MIYEFFSCSTNIRRRLSAYKPKKLVVYFLIKFNVRNNGTHYGNRNTIKKLVPSGMFVVPTTRSDGRRLNHSRGNFAIQACCDRQRLKCQKVAIFITMLKGDEYLFFDPLLAFVYNALSRIRPVQSVLLSSGVVKQFWKCSVVCLILVATTGCQ